MRVQNPARFAQVAGHLQQIQTITAHAQQIQQAQAQQAAQQFEAYKQAEDNRYTDYEKTRPATEVRAVRENLLNVLTRHYDVDPHALEQLWHSSPVLRSAPVQRLLYDVVRFHLAQDGIKAARPSLPPVMRPGEDSFHDDGETAQAKAAMRQFQSNPNPKSAAAALMARRRASR